MNYRKDKYGNELSVLGFGCMRFSRRLGAVDMKKTERQILYAVRHGINYFDTAYIYPGSEAALGEILERHTLRHKVFIASKLPHYLIKKKADLEKMFNEELRRLRTDRIDYYLMHMLTDTDTWDRLKELGIEEWIAEKKKSGAIGQIGFSYHGNASMFCSLTDAYDWDLAMIQYNYLDENTQAGKTGLRHANKKGLPVMIMEPLRGGKLVKGLPEKAKKLFSEYTPIHSPAEWSFKWLWDQPEVTVVLSGMNDDDDLKENINAACSSRVGELTDKDRALLRDVALEINSKMRVGCTGCGYCTPCPKNVDIPGIFAAYNRRFSDGKFWSFVDYVICTALRKNSTGASNCVGCGKCEKHCPQSIEIQKELAAAKKEFEGPLYRAVRKAVSKFAHF